MKNKTNQNKSKSFTILKLDYDGIKERTLLRELKRRRAAIWFFKYQILDVDVYSTRKGYHVHIKINKRLTNKDTVFLQLALGSDFYRECFYWKRIKYPVLPKKEWNILFRRKYYPDGKIGREKLLIDLSLKVFKLLINKTKKTKQLKRRYKNVKPKTSR